MIKLNWSVFLNIGYVQFFSFQQIVSQEIFLKDAIQSKTYVSKQTKHVWEGKK